LFLNANLNLGVLPAAYRYLAANTLATGSYAFQNFAVMPTIGAVLQHVELIQACTGSLGIIDIEGPIANKQRVMDELIDINNAETQHIMLLFESVERCIVLILPAKHAHTNISREMSDEQRLDKQSRKNSPAER